MKQKFQKIHEVLVLVPLWLKISQYVLVQCQTHGRSQLSKVSDLKSSLSAKMILFPPSQSL